MNRFQSIEMWRIILANYVVGAGDDYLLIKSEWWSGTLFFAMHEQPYSAQWLTVMHVHPNGWYVKHPDGTNLGAIRGTDVDRLKRLKQMSERWEYQNK
jgi:hypothetical protein